MAKEKALLQMNHRDIPGWGENLFPLYDFAVNKFESGSHLVEVGAFLGMSICYAAQAIKRSNKNIRLDCIDIWSFLDGCLINKDLEWALSQSPEVLEIFEKSRKYVLENGGNFFEAFKKNLEICNVSDLIVPYYMSSEQASQFYKEFQRGCLWQKSSARRGHCHPELW